MISKWNLIINNGYTFEFEHEDHINTTIRIFTTKGEKAAWKGLERILNEKIAK